MKLLKLRYEEQAREEREREAHLRQQQEEMVAFTRQLEEARLQRNSQQVTNTVSSSPHAKPQILVAPSSSTPSTDHMGTPPHNNLQPCNFHFTTMFLPQLSWIPPFKFVGLPLFLSLLSAHSLDLSSDHPSNHIQHLQINNPQQPPMLNNIIFSITPKSSPSALKVYSRRASTPNPQPIYAVHSYSMEIHKFFGQRPLTPKPQMANYRRRDFPLS